MEKSHKWLNIMICYSLLHLLGCGSQFDINHKNDKLFTSIPVDYSGLDFKNPLNETKEHNHLVNDEFITGAGVAVGDINNDGLQDIFFTGNQVRDRLYLNKGNFEFEDISDVAGIMNDKKWSTGVTFVDIDNDGDQDIYVCRNVHLKNEESANLLYINNGDLTFSEKAESYGLDDKGYSVQAVFFDFDKDNKIDMYLVNQPPGIGNRQGGTINPFEHQSLLYSDKIYKNLGPKGFSDFSDYANTRNFAYGLSATVGDFNNDSWPDIYVSNDFDMPDHIYINQRDGTFKNAVNHAVKHISNFSMGTDVADYDNDGHLDIMVVDMVAEDHKRIKTNMGGMQPEDFWKIVNKGWHYQYMYNTLQRNNGNGTFSELAQLGGVSSTDWSWGPLIADFDNDGHKDIFVTNGVKRNMRHSDISQKYDKILDSLEVVAKNEGKKINELIDIMKFVEMTPTDKLSNYIFKNNGDYTFSKKIKEWGLELPTLSNGAAYADFDNDGDLDLVVNNVDDFALLYKNNASENAQGNFVRFKLIPDQEQSIYGTKVSLYQNNQLWQTFEVTNVRGYMSKSEDIVHFGLGNADRIDRVEFKWQSGVSNTLHDVEANQLISVDQNLAVQTTRDDYDRKLNPMFSDIASELGLSVIHRENGFDDYEREVLLPHKMSQFGPALDVGDVNGDGREDFFMGASAGRSGSLFLQNAEGKFDRVGGVWEQDKACEDMGVSFFDFDGDRDLDLFVVSGGNEFNPGDKALEDRLYINEGQGRFSKSKFPDYRTSGSCVVPFDYDDDGDLDLFVGGRLVPGAYPRPADSHLLENRSSQFVEITDQVAPEMRNLGLVTSARWTDYDGDGLQDLIVVGEWMPITIFRQNKERRFEKLIANGLDNSEGWYYGLGVADIDGDGDEDFVVGNLGLNYKYKASIDEPFEVYSSDFDDNGSLDIVLSYYDHGDTYPVRGKSCSSQQIPDISRKFETYEMFGDANLKDVYGTSLDEALNYQAKTFASAYVENLGDDKFRVRPLPALAQVSSINNILIKDYDLDGHQDLLISGNLYQSEIETPRNDAMMGLYLRGDGNGNFDPTSINESGFFAPHDARCMKSIKVGGKEVILVANNQNYLQAIEYVPPLSKDGTNLLTMKN